MLYELITSWPCEIVSMGMTEPKTSTIQDLKATWIRFPNFTKILDYYVVPFLPDYLCI